MELAGRALSEGDVGSLSKGEAGEQSEGEAGALAEGDVGGVSMEQVQVCTCRNGGSGLPSMSMTCFAV